jgi:UDP-N-acetylglucosamine--N-acetylmuramyl-(pentapeptide) pyrophosphoryl-undecaprenol N-acetylglucosamine transferase
LVPYPHAAENHQTVNASILVNNGAALMVSDANADTQLSDEIIKLIGDSNKLNAFGEAAGKLFVPDADMLIAKKIIETIEHKNG